MRIVHVLDHSIPLHSGYTFRTRAILEGQRRLGWQTAHVTSGKQGTDSRAVENVDGLDFHRTPAPSGASARVPVLNQLRIVRDLRDRLAEVIQEFRPDLVHAHSPALNGLAALAAAGRFGLPVVYECRAFWEDAAVDLGTSREGGLRYRGTRGLENRVFRRANAITTICEGLRKDILSRGFPASKVTVIPNAVDAAQFEFQAPRDPELARSLGVGDGPVIGFIGSFYAYEGLDLLIDALPDLRRQHPSLQVLLVGGGNEAAALKTRAQRLGVEEQVNFTGRVPHSQVARYYSLVDLFIYPRKSMRLTELVTPLKPLEAMAQGKIVLASDVGGHRELLRDGHTGYLFTADDARALASRVLEAIEDRANWGRIRECSRAYVANERTWQESVSRYIPVYESLAGN